MKLKYKVYLPASLISILGICLMFSLLRYVDYEGFCPADDGVVLAQAYRIFNGELPHISFISTKPVFSGIFHSFLFALPFPVEVSARWMTVIEFLSYSFLWTWLIFTLLELKFRNRRNEINYFIITGIFISIMNTGNFILFPVTTIDAILFSVAGTMFFSRSYNASDFRIKELTYIICGLFFAGLAALSRQSFVFVPLVFIIISVYNQIRKKNYRAIPVLILLGLLPFWIYLAYLIYQDATSNFFVQITGRTEFFETAILRLLKSFVKSKLLIFNSITLFFISVNMLEFKDGLKISGTRLKRIIAENKLVVQGLLIFLFILVISLSFNLFIVEDRMFIDRQFDFFWIYFVLVVFAFTGFDISPHTRHILFVLLLISWCSSISLGANSPVFTVGLLAGTCLVIIVILSGKLNVSLSHPGSLKLKIISYLMLASFLVVSLYGQRRVNYYDLPSSGLKFRLGNLIPGFGNIRTNKISYDYYKELVGIYNSYKGMKNNFVILPNNSVLYPLLESRNPFPVDWMQHDEYIGSENLLYSRINDVLETRRIFVIIDRFDSQNMPFKLDPVDYSGSQNDDLFIKKYQVEKYDFMKYIMPRCIEIPVNSKYFRLYKTN